MVRSLAGARKRLNRPVTYAEKVLFAHLRDPLHQELERGMSYTDFTPTEWRCKMRWRRSSRSN